MLTKFFRYPEKSVRDWIVDNEVRFVGESLTHTVLLSLFPFFLTLIVLFLSRDVLTLQHCRSQNKTDLECYYLPLSKCTIKDALRSASGEVQTLQMPLTINDDPSTRVNTTYEDHIIKVAAGQKK